MILLRKKIFGLKDLEMRAPCMKMNPKDRSLEEKGIQIETQDRGHVRKKADIGWLLLEAQECHELN